MYVFLIFLFPELYFLLSMEKYMVIIFSVEANFPVGAVAVQVVDGGNQVVVEETVYFEGDAVRIHTEGLEQGEYQLVLKLGSMTYKGLFRVN